MVIIDLLGIENHNWQCYLNIYRVSLVGVHIVVKNIFATHTHNAGEKQQGKYLYFVHNIHVLQV